NLRRDRTRCRPRGRLARSSLTELSASGAGSVPGCDKAGLVGEHDGLDAVSERELAEDAFDVCLYGRLADCQFGGDLAVGHAACGEGEDLSLSWCQVLEAGRGYAWRCCAGELLDQALSDCWGDQGVAGSDDAYGGY